MTGNESRSTLVLQFVHNGERNIQPCGIQRCLVVEAPGSTQLLVRLRNFNFGRYRLREFNYLTEHAGFEVPPWKHSQDLWQSIITKSAAYSVQWENEKIPKKGKTCDQS
jgi:hypothetical protein